MQFNISRRSLGRLFMVLGLLYTLPVLHSANWLDRPLGIIMGCIFFLNGLHIIRRAERKLPPPFPPIAARPSSIFFHRKN
jgi:hypothetical protein